LEFAAPASGSIILKDEALWTEANQNSAHPLLTQLPVGVGQFASNKVPRQINRNLIFHLVRTGQSISRADLARISRLQRSTVSLIIEELIGEGWVVEGGTGKLSRGRRPTILEVNQQRAVIALDIHPSHCVLGVGDLSGKIIARQTVGLPKSADRAIKVVVNSIKELMAANQDRTFQGIGITLPGRADLNLRKLVFAPNLNWPVRSIKAQIERATGLPVQMDNVANACALAEVWFGQIEGLRDLVVVNVSEGIGVGIYANGRILRGADGMAGEFGHLQVDPGGPRCGCGNYGCWETMASNRAGLRYYKEIAPDKRIANFEALVALAKNGDPAALKAIDKMARNLGRGMRMIATALAPGAIVVVGDVCVVWDRIAVAIKKELIGGVIRKPPRVRCSSDPNTARLRSAVSLVINNCME
jgi:predicted NBD/HSP70 family sugar kinase